MVEHYLDTVGVSSSTLLVPTIFIFKSNSLMIAWNIVAVFPQCLRTPYLINNILFHLCRRGKIPRRLLHEKPLMFENFCPLHHDDEKLVGQWDKWDKPLILLVSASCLSQVCPNLSQSGTKIVRITPLTMKLRWDLRLALLMRELRTREQQWRKGRSCKIFSFPNFPVVKFVYRIREEIYDVRNSRSAKTSCRF